MAGIARLAGQSRSTVGNWKARKPDFPAEHGHNKRGPLYRRDEVIAWLEEKGQLRLPDINPLWVAASEARGEARPEELTALLLLMALVQQEAPDTLTEITSQRDLYADRFVHDLTHALNDLPDWLRVPAPKLSPHSLLGIVHIVRQLRGEELRACSTELVQRVAQEAGRSWPSPPPSAADLLVALANPSGVVYDPAAGQGVLLLKAAEHHAGGRVATPITQLVGDDNNESAAMIAYLQLRLAGARAEFAISDYVTRDPRPGLEADTIVTAPPIGVRLRHDLDPGDPRWRFGEPGKDADALWLQHAAAHLASSGRAALLVAGGVLVRGGPTGRVMQRMAMADLIDAVVLLPAGLLLDATPIMTAALVIARDRINRGSPAEPGPILMIDASQAAETTSRRRSLPDAAVQQITDTYSTWAEGADVEERSDVAVVSYPRLAANDFAFDPRRYTPRAAAAVDPGRLRAARSELKGELAASLQAASAADQRLITLLKDIS